MDLAGGLNYAYGPAGALAGVGVLALVLRWIYGSSPAAPPVRDPEDFGLLVEVERTATAAEADSVRDRLAGAGVRCTVAGPSASPRVLVFPADLERARAALRTR